jgi:hypothetical protein
MRREALDFPKLTLPVAPPYDGEPGIESGIGEGHPGTPPALARGYHREYMQELPESVQQMVGTVYEMLMAGRPSERVV